MAESKSRYACVISWPESHGPAWMNKDNLQICINKHCGVDTGVIVHDFITSGGAFSTLTGNVARSLKARNAELMDEIIRLQNVAAKEKVYIKKLGDMDAIKTALATICSMQDDEPFWNKNNCTCEPAVGLTPCQYCAIHKVLMPLYTAAKAAEEKQCQTVEK